MESRRECAEAQRLLGMLKAAFPEVLTAIKTKQLAQEILLNKEEHIGEVAKTGNCHVTYVSQHPFGAIVAIQAGSRDPAQEQRARWGECQP